MTQAKEARERMIQRNETEQQTRSRHFRADMETFKGKSIKRHGSRATKYCHADYSDREQVIVDAINRDLMQAGIIRGKRTNRIDGRTDGSKTMAALARQRMIERMMSGGDEQ